MVQNKHHKSKGKAKKHPPHAKKQGKPANISEFCIELDALGLKVIQVTADGNCFFRALADQLDGNEEEHEKNRNLVVQYIMHMSPHWYIQNFAGRGARMIHLSYHDGEHYNSVRMKEDPCDGPAKPVSIKADVNLTASSQSAKNYVALSKSSTSEPNETLKLVMAACNCTDAEKVGQVLQLVDGDPDPDAAIEFLIAESECRESVEQNIDYNGYDESTSSNKLKANEESDIRFRLNS